MEYPIFKQEDYPQEIGMGEGYTIARYGCALCCVTSVCNWYGRSVGVLDLNTALAAIQGFSWNNTTNADGSKNYTLLAWSKIAQLYGEILLERNVAYPTTPADMNMIDSYLIHNKPVIVGVSFTHNPQQQVPSHYVVLYKKNEDNTYQCFDPWFGDRVVFDTRYAVNGMSVANAILQVVAYSGPAPQDAPAQAPLVAHVQEAVTPIDNHAKEAQDNWNLYLQEVDLVKQKTDRIVELETVNQQLTDANTKLTVEIGKTKDLNSNLAQRISEIESQDSTAIEEGLKAQDQLKSQQEIVQTVSGVLHTKPTMKGILSEIDALFMKLRFAPKSQVVTPTLGPHANIPPVFERVDPLLFLGLKTKGVSK